MARHHDRKYAARPPVGANVVSLCEGGTPLIHAEYLSGVLGADIWLKLEGANPTGSFKDRGMTMAISGRRRGAQAVICASTGNTSASAAAYAGKAGLVSAVLIPDGKIAMAARAGDHPWRQTACGAREFDDCLTLARDLADEYPVSLVNSVNPVRIQGQKTAAFEIVDRLGDAPLIHRLPVGNAGNITAYWLGYREYADDGTASRLPQMGDSRRSRADRDRSAGAQSRDDRLRHPDR